MSSTPSPILFLQRSLEDEINRTTGEDIPIFTISYLVVFAYIALALGEYTTCRSVLVSARGPGGCSALGCSPGCQAGGLLHCRWIQR